MADTLISSEVDFDAPGHQSGFLRLPHSTHHSAYGWIPIPVTCISGGDGPTVLMTAGVHGDEYEGQIALAKLARSLSPEDVAGRLILLPMTNQPAAMAGLRTSPIDGGNLNRVFPGARNGTPTEILAHYLEEVLLPKCDVLVDLHSGGSSLYYPPTLLRGMGVTPEESALLLRLQTAFDLPYAWVFTSGGGRTSTARTAMGAGNRNGVVGVMAELGGGGAVTPEVLAMTERGLKRILVELGMIADPAPEPPRGTRELHAQGSVFARDAGIFEPFHGIADTVAEGDTVGMVHFPDAPHRAPEPVVSPYTGIVLARRMMGRVVAGDAVAQIARDADPRP